MVKIDGKNLPARAPREHLLGVVRHLAKKYLNMKLSSYDIGTISRMNASRRAPILVK